MYIFEITKPGTWLDIEDRDKAWEIEGILRNLESQFYEANVALNLFESVRAIRPRAASKENWEKDSRRRSEISEEIAKEYGGDYRYDNWEELHFKTEIAFKREQWSKGILPTSFEGKQSLIYAKSFIYALDGFDKFLKILSEEKDVPELIAELYTQFGEEFPDLRGVRNTSQHLEDRSRGLGAGRNPQPLNIKPVQNNMVNAPGGGVLILNALNGTKYGNTMGDGHYGEVDVSPESMAKLQYLLQSIFNAFSWKGSKEHCPR